MFKKDFLINSQLKLFPTNPHLLNIKYVYFIYFYIKVLNRFF